jgi:hypothetical protein
MGLNTAVIIVNKNVATDFNSFAKSIGLEVVFEKDVHFEYACSNYKKEFIDVFFTEIGSLLFVPIDEYKVTKASKNGEIAIIAVLEFSNTFTIRYAKNGKIERNFTLSEGELYYEEGAVLPFEQGEDLVNKMSLAIETFTGKGLWDFENDTANRYRIIKKTRWSRF